MTPTITFIFDDAYNAEYIHMLPLFKKYNMSACTAVTANFIGCTKLNTGELYSTIYELLEMQENSWEILSHGLTHTNLMTLSEDDIDKELRLSKEVLTQLGLKVNNLVYPFHANDEVVRECAKKYYRSARGNYGISRYHDLYNYSGVMIDDHSLINKYKRYVDNNVDWLVFYCHLCTSQIISSTLENRIEALKELVEHCAIKKAHVITVNEAINEIQGLSR